MTLYDRIMNLDRRWVYLAVGLVVTITAIWSFPVPLYVTPEVRSVYDFMESLTPGEILMIGVDYDPAALAELHHMSYAITRQCFAKDVKMVFCCLHQNGPGMVEQVIAQVAEEYDTGPGGADSDSIALKAGYITVTPLRVDMTQTERLGDWAERNWGDLPPTD